MKFRKKPIIIEAYQFFYPEDDSFPNAVSGDCYKKDGQWYYMDALKDSHKINNGDWIMVGVDGEEYPISDKLLKKIYEPVKS